MDNHREMTEDERYMARAIEISRFAEGRTAPNPMVGAVVVHEGRIIGEGYHHRAGEPHAEPNAVRNAEARLRVMYDGDEEKVAEVLRDSTIYVTLEPCSHYGKTPPCAKLLAEKRVKRVVIGAMDSNPLVSGRGVKMMEEAGIEVVTGVLERECRWVNRRFFTFHEKKRPYVVLKWAETADGFIDLKRTERGDGPLKISNAVTKTLNHQMRCEEGAIMVATNTAILDDPHLTVTKWSGRNPVRVLLDRRLRVPRESRIFDGAARTIVFTECEEHEGYGENVEFVRVGDCPRSHHVMPFLYKPQITQINTDFCLACDSKNYTDLRLIDIRRLRRLKHKQAIKNEFSGRLEGGSCGLVEQVLRGLYDCGVQSVIIEGGAQWLNAVIESGEWDEAHVERSSVVVGEGVRGPLAVGHWPLTVSRWAFSQNEIINWYK